MSARLTVFILLLLGLVRVSAQNPSVRPTPPADPDELTRRVGAAETFQIAGDLAGAERENRAILAVGLRRLGHISLEEGRWADAAGQFARSKIFDDNARVRTDLAYAYLQLDETGKALEEARGAVALDPKNANARYLLGNILYTKGDYEAALPELERVLVLAPNFDAARALGLTYLYLKQPARAKLLFEEMQAGMPKPSADLHVLFGQAYEQTNYPREAEAEFARALALNPKQPKASFFLGYVILQHGGSARLGEAAKAFERELLLTPDDFFANFFAGVVASTENNHPKALGFLRKAVAANPQSGEAHLFLGQSLMETDDLKAAEKALRRALELTPNVAKNGFEARRMHYLLGRLLVRDGRREEGAAELKKAQELQAQLLQTTRDELSLLLDRVVETGAKKTPGPATAQNSPVDLPAGRADALQRQRAYLADVLAQAHFNLAVGAVQQNRLPEALENFAAASRFKPDFPNLDRSWGIVAFRATLFAQSLAPLARHVKTAPRDALARRMLGASYYLTNDFVNAVAVLKPVEAMLADDAELAYFYGVSLIRLERNPEARPIFDRLARAAQKNAETLKYAAQGFMLLGDYERAAAEFRTVAALAPAAEGVQLLIGQALIRLNRYAEAEEAFARELAVNPASESAKYHLALTLIERKTRIEEAVKLLREAVALRFDYADAQYQLGKIHLERGETAEAIDRLEAAARADATKDYIHYQLSIAYRRAARKEDADRQLKLYQELKAASRKTEIPATMGGERNNP